MTKRLLIVNTYGNLWSTGRIAAEIGDIAEKHGWQYRFAYAREANLEESRGIKITRSTLSGLLHTYLFSRILNLKGFGSIIDTWLFIREIKKFSPDLIHLHNIHQNFLNFPLLFSFLHKANIPVVWTLHDCWVVTGGCTHFAYYGCEQWRNGCHRCPRCGNSDTGGELKGIYRTMPWVLKRKVSYFTAVPRLTFVAVSEWLAAVVRSSAVGTVPVRVITNGVDTSVFYPREESHRLGERYGWGNRFVVVGVASHWSAAKGLPDYYKLRAALPIDRFAIVMVGLTPQQIADLPEGIIGIERTGSVDELASIYSAADVVVSLSYQESFGTTPLESFACGTPVVAYDNTSHPEQITSATGRLVESGNIARAAEAVIEVCEKGKSFYSQACRAEACVRYDKNRQFEQYIELYEQLLGSRKENCKA
ncbi:glycosyltransferase [Barnesiella viscericola]|uniref:glycosyltransferase n=1 Tax=Barnesiella viscericola TaxID=397865 RepID=UPI0025A35DED|nr:glycosyltransferase [Barnesiella viscericola]MDM8269779.1 glycosyltransferase [Barnesiella viscericola]